MVTKRVEEGLEKIWEIIKKEMRKMPKELWKNKWWNLCSKKEKKTKNKKINILIWIRSWYYKKVAEDKGEISII